MSAQLGVLPELIGRSAQFQRVLQASMRLANRPVPVLIEGETGTGKEEIARFLHYKGDRERGPFVALNCGAIQDSLFERELFGHVRGAFTDAHKACEGLSVHADGGTLFFDEIEALSEKGQVTLLRFLQDYEVRPVGATTTHKVDVRVVGATNENLEARIKQDRFRLDLYFRIAVVTLSLPPLRERREDILALAEHFAADYAGDYRLPRKPFSAALRSYLLHHSWPGNIRELQNLIHRATIFSEDAQYLDIEHALRAGSWDHQSEELPSLTDAKRSFSDHFERHYIEIILTETMGNVSLAARCSGKDRSAFRKLMKKHHLEREEFLPGRDSDP